MNVVESLRKLGRVANRDLVAELATIFLQGAPARIADMRLAVEASNGEALASAAHSLRGSAGNLGVVELAALCELIEIKATEGRVAAAANTVAMAAAELARVTPWLESLLPAAPGQSPAPARG